MKNSSIKYPMIDLFGQYEQIEAEVLDAIKSTIRSSAFINGPAVKEFEKQLGKYIDSNYTIPCGNGTDALQIALMALDLQPGDEVIVQAFTYIATVEVICLLQLKPVFVDVNPNTYTIDFADAEAKVTDHTKAIIAVHLFGQCAAMEPLIILANNYGLALIEDNAQALGAQYTTSRGTIYSAGTMGTIGTTSFFPTKNLGAFGDGGAIFTQDASLAEKIRMIANHGQRTKYYHEIVGVNSRLDSLHAAILSVKLNNLDQYAAKRQAAAAYYDQRLDGNEYFSIPARLPNSTHVFHQYTLKIKEGRDELREYLISCGIASMIYYPLPQHLQKAYLHYGHKAGDFPISEKLCKQVLSIPIHTQMKEEDLDYISTSILRYFTAKG